MNIAIQGGKASFHDIAARQFFDKDITTLECSTFREVCELVKNGRADFGLMAIENSIAGSILNNYGLLQEYGHFITGEYKLRIKQNLMALPGQRLEDITLVRSHYMALLQCGEFLDQFPRIQVEKSHDTADSAREIREKELKGVGAIAGDYAAELYDLEILAESVETIKLNYTRFLVISTGRDKIVDKGPINKATLSFELPDEVGSLAQALKIIVDYQINLTKIQSIPIIGRPDQYTFYLDCVWNSDDNLKRCLVQLNKLIHNMRILGEYHNMEITYDHIKS